MKITILILFSLFLGSEALGQQPGSKQRTTESKLG